MQEASIDVIRSLEIHKMIKGEDLPVKNSCYAYYVYLIDLLSHPTDDHQTF